MSAAVRTRDEFTITVETHSMREHQDGKHLEAAITHHVDPIFPRTFECACDDRRKDGREYVLWSKRSIEPQIRPIPARTATGLPLKATCVLPCKTIGTEEAWGVPAIVDRAAISL